VITCNGSQLKADLRKSIVEDASYQYIYDSSYNKYEGAAVV